MAEIRAKNTTWRLAAWSGQQQDKCSSSLQKDLKETAKKMKMWTTKVRDVRNAAIIEKFSLGCRGFPFGTVVASRLMVYDWLMAGEHF